METARKAFNDTLSAAEFWYEIVPEQARSQLQQLKNARDIAQKLLKVLINQLLFFSSSAE